MANVFIYTPCKDKKYENCKNYQTKCDECTHKHEYVLPLAKPHKNYYEEIK
jgi:hypothetical protein